MSAISEEEFARQFQQLLLAAGPKPRLPLSPREIHPVLNEREPSFSFDGHYVYHMGWAAEMLGKLKPAQHVDIGSHHHFSLVLSGFVPTLFLDYRPMKLQGLENLHTGACDLKKMEMPSDSVQSLSCMHVLEHIGLGRYGDELDYDGDIKAAKELSRVLAPGGDLLMVVPVGRPRIVFNAHRIYSASQVLSLFSGLELCEFSLIPDSFLQTGLLRKASFEQADAQEYGCGCFWLRKPTRREPMAWNAEQASYSQCGEDRIMAHLLYSLSITQPSYLDIGAHHPWKFSNTYYFYKQGARGVLVEPDPVLFEAIQKERSDDICLNAGIGSHEGGVADFFIMDATTLNTFSKETAIQYEAIGRRIVKTVKVPLYGINELLGAYFPKALDILSIDVEGLDFEILSALDFSRLRPRIICAETLAYSEDRSGRKIDEIIALLQERGYKVYADTYINTIFVDAKVWSST